MVTEGIFVHIGCDYIGTYRKWIPDLCIRLYTVAPDPPPAHARAHPQVQAHMRHDASAIRALC
jgi:hypothetical protein